MGIEEHRMPRNRLLLIMLIVVFTLVGSSCGGGRNTQSGTAAPARPTVIVEREGTAVPLMDPTATSVRTATPIASPTPDVPDNLVYNGDFASDWTDGWHRDPGSPINGENTVEVIQTSQVSSGQAARLVHSGAGNLVLSQKVEVPSADVVVRMRFNPRAETPCRGILRWCSGTSGVVIHLHTTIEGEQTTIGEIYYLFPGKAEKLFLSSDADSRIIFVPEGWQSLEIPLRSEIVNSLPGVDPESVTSILVAAIAGSVGNCRAGECLAEVQVGDFEVVEASQ
jgi:hypothetical protein